MKDMLAALRAWDPDEKVPVEMDSFSWRKSQPRTNRRKVTKMEISLAQVNCIFNACSVIHESDTCTSILLYNRGIYFCPLTRVLKVTGIQVRFLLAAVQHEVWSLSKSGV